MCLCVCMCLCMCACMCVPACGGQELIWNVFLNYSSPFVFWGGLSLILELLIQLEGLANKTQTRASYLSLPSNGSRALSPHLGFHVYARDQGPCHHTWVVKRALGIVVMPRSPSPPKPTRTSNGWNVRYFHLDVGPPWLVSAYSFLWNPGLSAMAAVWPGPHMCPGCHGPYRNLSWFLSLLLRHNSLTTATLGEKVYFRAQFKDTVH